ncbi:MAG: hypothetical protein PHX37_01780 [Eubacteriales bacterium]|nr:hypothetical protein [Eubacteriales bacterium]
MSKRILFFVTESLKFYKLKTDFLANSLFLFILPLCVLSAFLPLFVEDMLLHLGIEFIAATLVNIAAMAYVFAFVRDLKNETTAFASVFGFLKKRFFSILPAALLFSLFELPRAAFIKYLSPIMDDYDLIFNDIVGSSLVSAAYLLYELLLLLLFLVYIFTFSNISDKGDNIVAALKNSRKMTKGKRPAIFIIFLIFNIVINSIAILVSIFTDMFGSGIAAIVSSGFVGAVAALMKHRLWSLLYYAAHYSKNSEAGS